MPSACYQEGGFPPDKKINWLELVPQLGPTATAVARYDEILGTIANRRILLAPLSIREAVLSSRIENIRATMGEVLSFEAGQKPDSPIRRDDIREILNYRTAIQHAEEMLDKLPLSQRVLCETHRLLLSGARGQGKTPGEYRRIPNWIGPLGCSINTATYVPIGADKLPDAMGAWERYIHQKVPDRLVQLAILHAEFEALHPFLDGNGRLGRMLVPLFMWQTKFIREPVFCISAWIEARREIYYERLLAVSRDGDWTGWCQFFLEAVRAQAEEDLATVRGILDLYNSVKNRLPEFTRSRYALLAVDWIFNCPIFKSTDFLTRGGIPKSTARRILDVLHRNKILRQWAPGRGRRADVFVFSALLNLVERKEVY